MKINGTFFLCGYFTAEGATDALPGWKAEVADAKQTELFSNFYFPEFVAFHKDDVRHFSLGIDRDVSIRLRSGKDFGFKVTEDLLWAMPGSLALFAVRIDAAGKDIDEVTEAMGILRSCSFYADYAVQDFIKTALEPIEKTYEILHGPCGHAEGNYSHLVENGNKFKIFQILDSPQCPDDPEERNRLLYAAATLSRHETQEPYSTDRYYYESTMSSHRLGVFSSWTAMMLLDTVTFLGKDISDFLKKIWTEDYFGRIYTYELFRKCYLYRHNQRFRSGKEDPSALQDELVDFERKYTFTSISYNFLPEEVDAAIVSGLDLRKEQKSLSDLIAQETSVREERSSRSRDRFLLFLTCLASMSAIYDTTCLLDEVIRYEEAFPSAALGYRLFSAVTMVIIAAAAFRSMRRK